MPPSAVLSTLNRLWPLVEASGISVAIAGGIALSYWGNPRSTQDVDLLMHTDRLDAVDPLLVQAGFRAKISSEKDFGLFHLNQYQFDPQDAFVTVEVDLMVSDSDYYSTASAERFLPIELTGVSVPVKVLSREDLILHKVYAGRLIDQADVQNMLEMHFSELDWPCLNEWSSKLGIQTPLNEAIARFRTDGELDG